MVMKISAQQILEFGGSGVIVFLAIRQEQEQLQVVVAKLKHKLAVEEGAMGMEMEKSVQIHARLLEVYNPAVLIQHLFQQERAETTMQILAWNGEAGAQLHAEQEKYALMLPA